MLLIVLVSIPSWCGNLQFGTFRCHERAACLWQGKMTYYVKRLKVVSELLHLQYRNGEEQPQVIAAIHRRGYRIKVEFPSKVETASFERNLVGIDLGSQRSAAAQPEKSIGKSTGDKYACAWVNLAVFQLSDYV